MISPDLSVLGMLLADEPYAVFCSNLINTSFKMQLFTTILFATIAASSANAMVR
jgi:hypothetical protein